ncbi:MAG: AmpG family muropeptide MFS transporter [Rhodanobacteraceae bacterium]
MSEATASSKPRRIPVWKAFTQPAAWTMFFFGFSSGLPFLMVSGTLAYWLHARGIELKDITMIASASLAYEFKFVWAPLLDRWRLPGLSRLGQRRGWLLLGQCGVAGGMLVMAALTPGSLGAFVAVTLCVAFFGATQDSAIDAYRIEIAPPEAQGPLVTTYVLGYRVGFILSGGVALVMADHMPWSVVYVAMAACMVIPIVTNFVAKEPEVHRLRVAGWVEAMRHGVVEPFVDFFRRYGWWLALVTLLFILLFKVPEQATIGGIVSPFYRDMGFSKTAIGTITKGYGVIMGIAGVFVGGAAVERFGVKRSLLAGIVLCGCSNFLYLWLIGNHGNLVVLTGVISGLNFTLGFLGPPAVAFLSSLVNVSHTATQYALLSSFVNLPGKLLGFFAGGIVMATSYGFYFALTVVAVIPAVLLFLWVEPRLRGHSASVQAGDA